MLQPFLKENHKPTVAHVSEYSLIFGSNETTNSVKRDFYRVLTLWVTSLPTYFHPRNNFHREKIENNTQLHVPFRAMELNHLPNEVTLSKEHAQPISKQLLGHVTRARPFLRKVHFCQIPAWIQL